MTAPSSEAGQLALDLPHTPGYELGDFLPAASNRAALSLVLDWPRWPGPACLLLGPPASGKSHLARIWADRAGAVLLRGAELWEPANPLARVGRASACAVDDADAVAEEDQLFHLWHRIVAGGGSLLLTASHPVPAWKLALADLRSRLMTATPIRIDAPDDELLGAILVKQLADRQITVDTDVLGYLTRRMERSFAAARAVVRALDRASLRARRPITLPLARAVLAELAADAATGEP